MIDDLHCNSARFWFVEWTRGIAVQCLPRFLIDLGFQGRLQSAVRIILAEEVGVADEEAFAVVVGVDEPAGDAFGAVAADFAGARIEDIHAVYLDAELIVLLGQERDVGLAEDDEEVAFAGVFEIGRHVEVCVHARLENRDPA